MIITQSPTDALLTHLELQRETQVWYIIGLEWSNHLDERVDQERINILAWIPLQRWS